MTDTHDDTHITPSYLRKAFLKYYHKNSDIINQKRKDKYHSMTPEQKETYLANIRLKRQQQSKPDTLEPTTKQPSKYSLLTPEQKEAYKAKQRENYQKRKLQKQEQTNEQKIIVDIPIDNLKIE